MEYVTIHKQESHGKYNFGIKIKVASDTLPDFEQKEIYSAVYTAVDNIKAEIHAAMINEDPRTINEIEVNKKLIKLFQDPIFVEEIPNEYCSDYYCRHIPWFIITTHIGRFKIGWRKRVINIDWSDTLCKEYSADLFKDETTTKYDHYIHAWSLEDAKRYITQIINSTK